MKLPVTAKAAAALGVVVMLAGLIIWLLWREADRQAQAAARTTLARELLATLDDFSGHLADAGHYRCAFLVRAEAGPRSRFEAATATARQDLRRLAQLGGREPAQQALLDGIRVLAERKLALLEQSVRLRQRQRFSDRRQQDLSQEALKLVEQLRAPLAGVRAWAEEALASQAERGWTSVRRTGMAVSLGQLVTVLVVGFASVMLTRELGSQQRTAWAARQAQQQAETHATEQSAQLAQSRTALAELTTLQAQLEEHFSQAQRLASLGRVTGEMVHDFNNLLNVILTCSELTLEGLSADDPSREVLAQAVKAGHHAANLTRRVLAVSRARPEAPGPRDLNAAVADMDPILRRVAGPNVEVEVALASELPAVLAGAGQVEQVLLNLVANARDAMPQGGRLTIRTEGPRDERAVLVVADSGCGMDDQTKARLFEPFFTTKCAERGTGLGMAIVHGAVQRCGGRIEVDSAPGRGTAIRVYLPLASKLL